MSNSKPDITRLLEFQKLLLAFSQVDRVTHRKHGEEFINENDSEHSYNLAMTAWYLASFFPELNQESVIKSALVHDLVEVHAGDTYVYASAEVIATKHEREAAALKQLKSEWADFPEMTDIIEVYETRASRESKFVYALDKVMPMMQIYVNNGHTWKQEKITLERLRDVKHGKATLDPVIAEYYEQLCRILEDSPHLIPPR